MLLVELDLIQNACYKKTSVLSHVMVI
uniref:Uncharacterized protein n=1 Tax=Arundo donax TaxID=35708 RepID=A0A0A9BAT7_ARUDO